MAEIFYHAVPGDWTREEKLRYLAKTGTLSDVAWADIAPNKKHQWLTGDLRAEFDTFIPLEGLNGIFRTVSYGVQTNRDDWVCNFNRETLETGVRTLIETYNSERERWHSKKRKKEQLDDFVTNDNRKIKWSSRLKECLLRNDVAVWEDMRIRDYLYRPFTKGLIYFDPILVHRRSKFPTILPSVESESENRFVWAKIGSEVPFWCLVANHIADSMTQGGTQAIPFYTYDGEDGARPSANLHDSPPPPRRENIPLSTLVRFQHHYGDEAITKWDIFHYVYAVLHHPEYRTCYAANLRRELPRIPLLAAEVTRLTSGPHGNTQ